MDSRLEISLVDRRSRLRFDEVRLCEAVRYVLEQAGIASGEISLAIVDDAEIHRVNREFLHHDYPTDVISFVLEHDGAHLEGEIVAGADYAIAEAERYGWSSDNELLLYVVHGALHLIGYDDLNPEAAAIMRAKEREILSHFGLTPPGRE